MRFLFDHDVPEELAYCLEALGHEVVRLRHVHPVTASDEDVLRLAAEQGCILITGNRDDFLAAARGRHHAGIVILIRRKSRVAERAALLRLFDAAGPQGLAGNINFA